MPRLKRIVSVRVNPIFGRLLPFKVGLALVWAWGASNALASPPPIKPRDVDFTGNHPMRNVEGMFPDPEVTWTSGGSYSAPAISIDIMGDLSVKFQHFNDSEKLGNATFQLNFAELEMPNGTTTQLLVNGQSSASGPVSIPAYGTFWSPTFQISGWDDWIHAGTLRVGYQINTSSIPGLVGFGMTREWRFLVNLAPPVGHMSTVWHELLEETTAYAWGKDSAHQVLKELTDGLFNSGRFTYTTNELLSSVWLDSGNFDLTRFLRTGGAGDGNCYDVAVYFHMLTQTQGLWSEPIQRFAEIGPYGLGLIVTNDICPIGSAPNNSANYNALVWSNHCVVFYFGEVYDACLALQKDYNLADYFQPPSAWSPQDHWYRNHGTEFSGISKRFLTFGEHLFGYVNPTYSHYPVRAIDFAYPFGGPI